MCVWAVLEHFAQHVLHLALSVRENISAKIQYQTFQHWANGLLSEKSYKTNQDDSDKNTHSHIKFLSLWISESVYNRWVWVCVFNTVYSLKSLTQMIHRYMYSICYIGWKTTYLHSNTVLFKMQEMLSKCSHLYSIWLDNTVGFLFHQCYMLQFQHYFKHLCTEHIIMCVVLCCLLVPIKG